jgi:hypothetical protein
MGFALRSKLIKYLSCASQKQKQGRNEKLIGFDSNANLLEIMYNVIDEQTVRVFHAMKCTNEHRALLET